jgi:tetratricopeptide (TPR) repeat protein
MRVTVSRLITGIVIVGCLLGLFVTGAATAQTRLKGRVAAPGNDPLVSREQVRIDGAGQYTTGDGGEFEFDVVQGLKVGQPARFHVYHVNPAIKIEQWIVVRPCDLVNGRKDSLPDIGPEPISIVVLPKGDARLKSLNKDYSILGCIIEEAASEFKPVSRSAGPKHSSLFRGRNPEVSGRGKYPRLYESLEPSHSPGFPRVVETAYRVDTQQMSSVPSLGNIGDSGRLDEVTLAGRAGELGFTGKELVEALDAWAQSAKGSYEMGLAALYEGRYAKASRYISDSIPSPPGEFLKRYVPLARAEYELGHYPAAEAALRRVLAVHNEDPLVLTELGNVLQVEGRFWEAEPVYKRALAIYDRPLAPDHLGVAIVLNNLAELYGAEGKFAEAEPLMKRALIIAEEALGPDHPDLAAPINNLASLYYSQGKFAEAEPLMKRALIIDEKALGTDHPNVAGSLNNLAELYDAEGKYGEAEPLLKRALTISEKALGPDHPHVAIVLNNLAGLYKSEGKFAEAEPLYKRELAIDEKALGPDHPTVAKVAEELAAVLRQLGLDAEAKVYEDRASRIRAKRSK